jgi:hypothetical protein
MEESMTSFNFGNKENSNECWDKCKGMIIEVAKEIAGKE